MSPDFLAFERKAPDKATATGIAWTHRSAEWGEIYFIANQLPRERELILSLRSRERIAEVWDPRSGEIYPLPSQDFAGRTAAPLALAPSSALFVVLRATPTPEATEIGTVQHQQIAGPWQVKFQPAVGAAVPPRPLAAPPT